MSRIHEALKKAEQDRVASQGGRLESVEAPEPVLVDAVATMPSYASVDRSDVQDAGGRVHASGVAVESAPFFSSQLTWDAVAARSVQAAWKPDMNTMLFFNQEENAQGTEQFRTLRSRLYHMREKSSLRTILVTSALPKEGKSFVAANLAQVLARQHGRRVLLIDGDMRAPRLHSALGTTSTPGLGDYLLGETDEVSVLQRGPMEGLFFVPSGRTVEHPAELIGNGRLKVFLQRVEPLFEWVIVDSPPAVPVSDASQLAGFCDGVLMVVRSSATPYDTAQRARQEFQGKTLVGVVLNGMPKNGSYAKYYYDVYERTPQR